MPPPLLYLASGQTFVRGILSRENTMRIFSYVENMGIAFQWLDRIDADTSDARSLIEGDIVCVWERETLSEFIQEES